MEVNIRLSALPAELAQLLRSTTHDDFLQQAAVLATDRKYTDILFNALPSVYTELSARWLRIKESSPILATFGRLIPFAPYLTERAERYFIFNRHIFTVEEWSALTPAELIELLLGLYRLLSSDNRTFGHFLNASVLSLGLSHNDLAIRYLTIRVLCLFLHAAEAAMEDMIKQYIGQDVKVEGSWEDKTIDYRFLSMWEERRMKNMFLAIDAPQVNSEESTEHTIRRNIRPEQLSENTCLAAGVLLPCSPRSESTKSVSFVPTPTSLENLNGVAEAVRSGAPLLLHGLAGSGKTMHVMHLARQMNKVDDLVTLHLNEQSDAKSLIGTYTSGSEPGSFEWKAGALTTAVKEGRWVFIEDLDRAPAEIISTLLPLIERRELHMHSRGETLHASPGFRLIATVRTQQDLSGNERLPNPYMIGLHFWRQVKVKPLPSAELHEMIRSLFPSLTALSTQIMAVYEQLKTLTAQRSFAARLKTGMARDITPRDLLKWCRRLDFLTDGQHFSDQQLDWIFLEAVDCFAGYLPPGEILGAFAAGIAQHLHIDGARRDYTMTSREISFQPMAKGNNTLQIGRAKIQSQLGGTQRPSHGRPFALNPHTLRLLERLGVSIQHREPLLLVGETGTGKTTCIQYLAERMGCKLVPFNLSQQSEVSDLLGGLKPVSTRTLVTPLRDEFEDLFPSTFSQKGSQAFVTSLRNMITKGQWKGVSKMWKNACREVEKAFGSLDLETNGVSPEDHPAKRLKTNKGDKAAKTLTPEARQRWLRFRSDLQVFDNQVTKKSSAFAFAYVEGSLVKAVRDGHWLLLDEINLASSDTLEALVDLLSNEAGEPPSLMLTESGNLERIIAHPNFRVFAAMNPATDVGKKDLPLGIRSRFTELYVDSPDRDRRSLESVVESYLGDGVTDRRVVGEIATLYLRMNELLETNKLVDGSGQKPHFSLRTLTRVLVYAKNMSVYCNLRRALCEGFFMSFTTLLDKQSEALVTPIIQQAMLGKSSNIAAELARPLARPQDARSYIKEGNFWLKQGSGEVQQQDHYIKTDFVKRNLNNLIRAISTGRYPILLQGPTSSGKTSMVEYLAKRSGNTFVRINNHEHTDLQEYLGSYVSDVNGILKFQEGVLVQALRNGYWIVLDELNLAPTDVLEALNRLLDDNRELLIPETQEVIRPHPDFMLFATQNPAGLYGGRKHLSRAFRNRFLELHFDDIPVDELREILYQRTRIPPSWAVRIVEAYKELSKLRQESRMFEQKSFATLRDLFRWALRKAESLHDLAVNGFMLLAERVRNEDERGAVREVLENVMSKEIRDADNKIIANRGPRVQIVEADLYAKSASPEIALLDQKPGSANVIWTKAMRRLFVLVAHAVRNNEPILLVGETGCGKTTVCQMLADTFEKQLFTINAHQNIETGDIIGSQRPVRNKAGLQEQLRQVLLQVLGPDYMSAEDEDIQSLLTAFDKLAPETTTAAVATQVAQLRTQVKALFEWSDGALIEAMRSGQPFLLDEISLADDSVLERLNSVLEPERTILLAEKGSVDSQVTATEGFQFLATMNPGGDYGKRELSPALRNRFTEIWVPAILDNDDVLEIVRHGLANKDQSIAQVIVNFAHWFAGEFRSSASAAVSIRDVLAWVSFMNTTNIANPIFGLYHGAALVFIDTLGANPAAILSIEPTAISYKREQCLNALQRLAGANLESFFTQVPSIEESDTAVRIGDFALPKISNSTRPGDFAFEAPTTRLNAMRILRALQLTKPILLEGNPGVGKTTIVSAITRLVGRRLVRINLSEQTDLMDLFGSDVPVEGAAAGTFAWRDAPFLSAMKNGDWVLLDEMNLASQSVLEGLNACLDHRGEVFIAELHRTFTRHPEFRIFAAQNPHHQGGGRKGLPSSFVNRFTVVYADIFRPEDLQIICRRSFPAADSGRITNIIDLVSQLDEEVAVKRRFGANGSPWEFNLRDTLRWLHLAEGNHSLLAGATDYDLSDMIFRQRFRHLRDQALFDSLVQRTGQELTNRSFYHNLLKDWYQVGMALLPRNHKRSALMGIPPVATHLLPIVETVILCIQQQWPVILVGSPSSGKSHVLQHVAAVAGKTLTVFPLDADIDAMDLVGGFEQADNSRGVIRLLDDIRLFVERRSVACVEDDRLEELGQYSILHEMAKSYHTGMSLHQLSEALRTLAASDEEAVTYARRCQELEDLSQQVLAAQFQWIDGPLVQALQEGHWLVLDNANLCSSSVLDRINSLLEPNGFLSINEHPTADGQARVVLPHPDFRIFMTMDPRHGELSRAMRNRAIELYLPAFDLSAQHKTDHLVSLESTTYRLRNYCQSYHLPSDLQQNLVAAAIADHLSPLDLPLIATFKKEIQNGILDTSEIEQQHSLAALEILEGFISQQNSLRTVSLQADTTSLVDWNTMRSMHPLNNEAFVRRNANTKSLALLATQTFETMLKVNKMEKTLNDYAIDAKQTQPATVLAISMIQPRFPAFDIGSAVNVAQFLLGITDALKRIAPNLDVDNTVEIQPSLLDYISSMWWRLFDIVDKTSYDEAIFQIHLSIVRDRLTTFDQSRAGTAIFDGLIKSFATPIQMKTGLAMESLWQVLRPHTSKDLKQLQDLLELEQLADRFDEVVPMTELSLSDVMQYRSALRDAMRSSVVGSVDVSELLTALRTILDRFTGSSANIVHHAFFEEIFRGIFSTLSLNFAANTAGLERDRAAQTSVVSQIAPLARLPTRALEFSSSDEFVETSWALQRQGFIADTISTTHQNLLSICAEKIRKVNEIPLSHLDLLTSEINVLGQAVAKYPVELCSDLNEALSANLECSRLYISQILQHTTYAPQFVHLYGSAGSEDSSSPRQLGKAWLEFAVKSILAYVPDKPFDPALKLHTKRDIHLLENEALEADSSALIAFERVFSGQPQSMRIQRAMDRMAALGQTPQSTPVIRPPSSQSSELQVLFNSSLQLTRRLQELIEDKIQLDNTIVVNLDQVLKRLSSNFPAYRDMTSPLMAFLRCAKIGLKILQTSQETPKQADQSALTRLRALSMGTVHHASPLEDLRLLAIGIGMTKQNDRSTMRNESSELFRVLYHEWRDKLRVEQEQEAKKSSLYVYRGDAEHEDEVDEDEFRAIFASNEDDDEDDAADGDSVKPIKDEQAEDSIQGKINPQKVATELASLHHDIFSHDVNPSESILDLLRGNDKGSVDTLDNSAALPTTLLLLRDQKQKLGSAQACTRTPNFYFDSNLEEAKTLLKLSRKVRTRFVEIQLVWPEHATLAEVIRYCDELAAMRHSEPLNKLITKLEKLHEAIHEWQTVASREYSAAQLYEDVKNLIVSWRRIELSTWVSLLDAEAAKVDEAAKSWWFVCYENMIAIPMALIEDGQSLEAHVRSLVETMQDFLTTTPIGQFSRRLSLLRQFHDHLSAMMSEHPEMSYVSNALANISSFFDRFGPLVVKQLHTGRATLEKKVKEIVQLASWKDTTIEALRQSAQASHRKLFKVVRKFRELLSQPASSIINQGIPTQIITAQVPSFDTTITLSLGYEWITELCQQEFADWSALPARFTNIATTLKLMRTLTTPSSQFSAAEYLTEKLSYFMDSVNRLQKATPSMLTDDNKDIVKHLKTRKRTLFAEILKEMRLMGLQHNLGSDILERQASTAIVFSRIPTFSSSQTGSAPALYHFDKFIELIDQVRDLGREHHGDLTPAEVIRSLGYFEAMLQRAIESRSSVATSMLELEALSQATAALEATCAQFEAVSMDKHLAKQRVALQQALRWLIPVLDVFGVLFRTQASLGQIDLTNVVQRLDDLRRSFHITLEAFDTFSSMPEDMVTDHQRSAIIEATGNLSTLQSDVSRWRQETPLLKPLLEQLSQWLVIAESRLTSSNRADLTISEYQDSLLAALDEALGASQDLSERLSALPSSNEEKAWLNKYSEVSVAASRSLHMTRITSTVTDLSLNLQRLPQNELRPALLKVNTMLPILEQYRAICQQRCQDQLATHTALTHMGQQLASVFIRVGKEGFCTPSEKSSGEEGQDSKLEGGTGLGEGEGAEDVSKDIGADEDLTELAEEKDKNERKDEIEDEKDAVDMADAEMEGQMGDVAEEEGEDKDSNGDEGSEDGDDMEEETGDVDDLGPSAVDEKMWDDGEQTEKDKEGDKGTGQKQEDEITASEQKDEAQKDGEDQDDEADDAAAAEETENGPQEQGEKLDEHLQEGENLDLPDEMQLEGASAKDSDEDDLDDMGDDMDMNDKLDEDAEGEEKPGDDDHELDGDQMSIDEISQDDETEQRDLDADVGSEVDEENKDEDAGEEAGELLADKENDANAAEDVAQSEARGQGTDAEENANDANHSAAAAQRQSGEASEENKASGGEAAEPGAEQNGKQDAVGRSDEQPQSAEQQAFRKLGDILERWHKQHNPIQRAKEDNDQKPDKKQENEDLAQADFEHLLNEDAEADAQALGAAAMDQAKALNEDMAIETEEQGDQKPQLAEDHDDGTNDQADPESEDEEMRDPDQNSSQAANEAEDKPSNAFIGEQRQAFLRDDPADAMEADSEVDDEVDEVDAQMSTVHLSDHGDETKPENNSAKARQLWAHYSHVTRPLAATLTSHLQLILAPTLATKLRGDFRTGKRLNIKRIIPYIASGYKRDKIWLRRSVPSKRAYQVLLAVDDSKSMATGAVKSLAYETLALVGRAMAMLEVGELSVVSFGADVHVAHEFGTPFTDDAGARTYEAFGFDQDKTDVKGLIKRVVDIFAAAKARQSSAGQDLWQLCLIISDGNCEDHASIQRLVRQAQEERIMLVFVVIDALARSTGIANEDAAPQKSIMDLAKVEFVIDPKTGVGKVNMERYMDTFPFRWWVVVRDIEELPGVLAQALRQWFREVVDVVA